MRTYSEETRLEILKNLLFFPASSIYDLAKRMDRPYPTIRRYVRDSMVPDGLIEEKEGVGDGRGQISVELTRKGNMYFHINGDLTEDELFDLLEDRVGVKNILEIPREYEAVKVLAIYMMHGFIAKLRARVNLKYYDDEYVNTLIGQILLEEGITMIQAVKLLELQGKKIDPSFDFSSVKKMNELIRILAQRAYGINSEDECFSSEEEGIQANQPKTSTSKDGWSN